jgi:hypothetical protein
VKDVDVDVLGLQELAGTCSSSATSVEGTEVQAFAQPSELLAGRLARLVSTYLNSTEIGKLCEDLESF